MGAFLVGLVLGFITWLIALACQAVMGVACTLGLIMFLFCWLGYLFFDGDLNWFD